VRAWTLIGLAAALVGCGGANAGAPGAAGAGGQPSGAAGQGGDVDAGAPLEIEGGACTAVIQEHADEGAFHVPCSPVPTYGTNPPSSGNHYDTWADFKTYTTPVPWGHLVHDLEHGAVVIVYNCPGGCPDEVAAAQAMIDGFPADPICALPPGHRLILAPDPALDVRWAASAWTWTIKAPCFDPELFGFFMTAHYGMGREDLCGELDPAFCAVAN
jgi:hypothetical protein